jgi:hypothetical protein
MTMKTPLIAFAPAVALALGLTATISAVPPSQAEPTAETLAERQERTALELEAENLLVMLHSAELDPELEPCINGAVSPTGRFPSAELERIAERLGAGDLTEHLAESAYYRAFNNGDIRLTE